VPGKRSPEIFVAGFVWVSALAAVIAAGWMPPSGEIVVHKREMAGSIKDLWPVISDHELYARLAPNLSTGGLKSAENQTAR
jgi:hypothetical protein